MKKAESVGLGLVLVFLLVGMMLQGHEINLLKDKVGQLETGLSQHDLMVEALNEIERVQNDQDKNLWNAVGRLGQLLNKTSVAIETITRIQGEMLGRRGNQ